MSLVEAIYRRTPIFVQDCLCSIEGARINRNRFDKKFFALLGEYESRSRWSDEELFDYRNRRIREFIIHCEHTVPYYRRLFKENDISSRDIKTLEDLSSIPILEKHTVQERYAELLSERIPERQRRIEHTSGTTGAGLRFAVTPESIREQWAVWWRYRRMHGIEMKTWCGHFAGRTIVPASQKKPPFWRYNFPGRQIMFSGYHVNEDNMRSYISELESKKPQWLHGYPSLLTLIAKYITENNIDLGYQVRWITVGAENLLAHQKNSIETAFGVKPIQHYGMAEGVANISEWPDGKLRIDEDFSAVEFIKSEVGSGFKVIGTNFTNPATPLLRYDCGDIVKLEDDSVDKRSVIDIDGRNEDYIILRDGTKVGRLDHIFKDMINVNECQLKQHKIGRIEIHLVKGNRYTSQDEVHLLNEFHTRVGNDVELNIEYVDSIERPATGKLRFVISSLQEGGISE